MSIRTELQNFIREAVNGDRSRYAGRSLLLAEDFAHLLGFKTKYSNMVLQMDMDPKWSPANWKISDDGRTGYVSDIRVMTFRHFYAISLMQIASKKNTILPNGMPLKNVIQCLIDIHHELKATYRNFDFSENSIYAESVTVAKYLINTLYPIIARYGKPIDIGGHHIVAKARERAKQAAIEINKTGVVLSVYCDEIIYKGDQVDIKGVHHEKFNKIIFADRGYAYGNDIRTHAINRLRFSDADEYYTEDERTIERLRAGTEKRITKAKAGLAAYFNRTLEDAEREFSVDCQTDLL